jgi:hypothetical protein
LDMDSKQTEGMSNFKYIVLNEQMEGIYCKDKAEAIESIQTTSTQYKQQFVIARIENVVEASVKTEHVFTLTENQDDVSLDGRGRLVKKERKRTFSATDTIPLSEAESVN